MKRIIFVTIIFLLLAGCASPKRIELIATPVKKPQLVLPKADVVTLGKIEWTLITESNVTDSFDHLRKRGRPAVFFGVTDRGYENLSLNFSNIRTYIQQQQAIISAYENYYFASESTIDTANSEISSAHKQIDKMNAEGIDKPSWWSLFKGMFTFNKDDE